MYISLIGALLPETFKGSDADFNVGMALASAQTLPAGVYVCMSGRVFNLAHQTLGRDQKTGAFIDGTPQAGSNVTDVTKSRL